jgi:RHS repeat-associated protein
MWRRFSGIAYEIFLTTYFYDSLNRLQETVDNLGQRMVYRYDSRDNLVAMADAQGPVTGSSISRRAFPDGATTVNTTNEFGNVTRYFYDGISRQVREEQILTASGEGDGINPGATIEGIKILVSGTATRGRRRKLIDNSKPFERNALVGHTLSIVGGTGAGQSRLIVRNTRKAIRVSEPWSIIPDETSVYEVSPVPVPDESQGGGDGFIRTGYVYDDNSLLSALIDDQGNITLYLYDNLNRQVTETKGLVVTSPFDESFILGDRRVVTPTAATINDPDFIHEEKIQLQIDGAKDGIDQIAHLFPPLADDVFDPPPPPQATTIVYGYDPDDNVLILEDENDSETFTKYDAINRAIAVRVFRSEGNPPTRDPDDFSNDPIFAPQPVNDFEGPHGDEFPAVIGTNHNNYEYDGLSRLTMATDNNDPGDDPMNPFADPSDDSTVTYAYDSLSRVIEEVQQIGPADVVSMTTGSNTATTLNDTSQTWVVDEWVGKLVKITNDTGESQIREVIANTSSVLTINRDWDEIPDVNSEYEILPAKAISSGYEADTRSSVIYPNGRKLNYTYDSLERLQSITDDGGAEAIVEYDYIGVGRVLERRSPSNDTRMTYLNDDGDAVTGYDGLRRTTGLRHLRDADNSLIVGIEYDYDRMNNRLFKRLLHDPANSELYRYDSAYRLIDFQRGELNAQGDAIINPSSDANQRQEWNLDGVGNWNQTTITDDDANVDVEDREHSAFNELIHREDSVNEDFRYDDNGNLIEDNDYLYEWDSRNRLSIVTRKADGVVGVYNYDAMGRRIRKEVYNSDDLNGVTNFYYDGNRVVEERDDEDNLSQQYVYGNYIDEVLMMDRNGDGDDSAIEGGDQRLHYHQDALFSVYAVTDEVGQILESYFYDPFGKVMIFDENGNPVPPNPWGTAHSAIANPYLFTGRRFDEETGLYYYRARYYDANEGRFISRDPSGYVDGMNLYSGYFALNSLDPTGTDKLSIITVSDVNSERGNVHGIRVQVSDDRDRAQKGKLDSWHEEATCKITCCPVGTTMAQTFTDSYPKVKMTLDTSITLRLGVKEPDTRLPGLEKGDPPMIIPGDQHPPGATGVDYHTTKLNVIPCAGSELRFPSLKGAVKKAKDAGCDLQQNDWTLTKTLTQYYTWNGQEYVAIFSAIGTRKNGVVSYRAGLRPNEAKPSQKQPPKNP